MKYKILIDSGNGGEDFGTTNDNDKAKDINLEISEYVSARLTSLEIANQLLRESDETLSFKERIKSLKDLIKDDRKIILISNNVNFSNTTNTEVIYSLQNNGDLARCIAKEISIIEDDYKEVRQKRLPINPNKDYHYLLRETPYADTVIIKYAVKIPNKNIANLKEELKICAEAVIKGITKFVGFVYIPEIKPGYYQVKSGDTLWSVAKAFNTTVDNIKRMNNLKNNALSVNQIIKVEGIEERTIIDEPNSAQEDIKNKSIYTQEEILHTVSHGETLYRIAEYYKLKIEDIIKANNLIGEEVAVGQILIVPGNKL